MKLIFTPAELTWLNTYIQALCVMASKRKELAASELVTTAQKMRYKFTPNASHVKLTGAQRSLAMSLVKHRHGELASKGGLTEESTVLEDMMKKLSGAA